MLRFKTINIFVTVTLVVLIVTSFITIIPASYYIILFVFWFFITLLGSTLIQWNYHLTSLNSNSEISEDVVAITFDDGPNPDFTPQVLALLKKFNVKATFFCIGRNVEANSTLCRQIISEGHTIGNHTYSHANNFGFFSTRRVISELEKTNKIIKEQTGLELKFYRPAFGVTNPRIKRALKITGLQSIGWNKRSLDTTPLSEQKILGRLTHNLKKGDIILLHDSSSKSVRVLEQLLLFLKNNKLESVTVDQLLEIKPYA
jgi:peptidoglycan/xylan/chitin deacetylase (PgdA/CDA1 family)